MRVLDLNRWIAANREPGMTCEEVEAMVHDDLARCPDCAGHFTDCDDLVDVGDHRACEDCAEAYIYADDWRREHGTHRVGIGL